MSGRGWRHGSDVEGGTGGREASEQPREEEDRGCPLVFGRLWALVGARARYWMDSGVASG